MSEISLEEITHIEINVDAIAAVQKQEITTTDFYIYCFVNLLDTLGQPIDAIINREDLKDSVERLFEIGLFYEEEDNEDEKRD